MTGQSQICGGLFWTPHLCPVFRCTLPHVAPQSRLCFIHYANELYSVYSVDMLPVLFSVPVSFFASCLYCLLECSHLCPITLPFSSVYKSGFRLRTLSSVSTYRYMLSVVLDVFWMTSYLVEWNFCFITWTCFGVCFLYGLPASPVVWVCFLFFKFFVKHCELNLLSLVVLRLGPNP